MEELTWYEPARRKSDKREKIPNRSLTTSILAKWMVKVGTTSKSDVTQKEKKP